MRDGSPQADVEADASFIADAFDDRGSLAWYRVVVGTVPREFLWDAFARARDVGRCKLRRSRAALFSSIVRGHVDRKRGRGRPLAPTAELARV